MKAMCLFLVMVSSAAHLTQAQMSSGVFHNDRLKTLVLSGPPGYPSSFQYSIPPIISFTGKPSEVSFAAAFAAPLHDLPRTESRFGIGLGKPESIEQVQTALNNILAHCEEHGFGRGLELTKRTIS